MRWGGANGIRSSFRAAGVLAVGLVLFACVLADNWVRGNPAANEETGALVARLGLTDLALFTEARYTRHPSQADLATPFQDHPLSLDHFPSSSLVPPTPPLAGGRLAGPDDKAVRP